MFCKIANKEINSRIVYEDGEICAFLDLNPQSPAHILIIPKKHIACLSDCGEDDIEILGRIQIAAKDLAEKFDIKDGFRLVLNNGRSAGQTVNHIHYHLLGGRRMNWPPG